MKCKFEDENGLCQTEYEGFACIKHKCAVYGKMFSPEEKGMCSYLTEDAKYCQKYKKFLCLGKEKCEFFTPKTI